MSKEDSPKKLEEVAAKALDTTASDFSNYTPPSGKLKTGEALAGIANIGANKLYSVAEVLDNLTSRRVLIAGWEYVERFILPKVRKKVEGISEENRRMPPLMIAGPVMESAKYTAEEPILSEMFATLLASSMDSSMADCIHPSFTEIIKQITPEEARIIKYLGDGNRIEAVIDLSSKEKNGHGFHVIVSNFSYVGVKAGNEMSARIKSQIVALCRLGLTQVPDGISFADKSHYKELEEAPELEEQRKFVLDSDREIEYDRKMISLTQLGRDFYRACVKASDFDAGVARPTEGPPESKNPA